MAALRSNEVVLAVQGQRGLGKKLLLQVAAAHWGKRILLVDGKRLGQVPLASQRHVLRALIRELLLLDAIPVLADLDDVVAHEADRDELPGFFGAFLDEWTGPVAITIDRERMPRIHHRPIVHITLEVPPLTVRTTMWRDIVPTLTEPDADSLSGRFAIPGGIIVAAAQAAEAGRMPDDPPPGAEDLARSVAAQLHQRISRLGKKLPTPFDLDDLIVDDDTRGALLEITAAARERRKIRDAFKLRGAQGISVLFSGHPGIGKTMSGAVLAQSASASTSTRSICRRSCRSGSARPRRTSSDVFDAAEPGHVVLLFNEADSLFGKRTSDVQEQRTIATRTSRPTTCCSASSGSTGWRS